MNQLDMNEMKWEKSKVDGVTSKDFLKHPNGTFKIVKLAPQATYPIHHHPKKTEFAFVLSGSLRATIGEEQYTGGRGSFYRFPVDEKHGLHNPGDEDTVVLIGDFQERE
jgi:quercetin dioxygenase-like cupin family protein